MDSGNLREVILNDYKNGKVYKVLLDPEEADRADIDITFRTNLLDSLRRFEDKEDTAEASNKDTLELNNYQQNNIKNFSNNNLEDTNTDEEDENFMPNISSNLSDDKGVVYRWPDSCVQFLLRKFEELEPKLLKGKLTYKKCWYIISQGLKDNGYNLTPMQCASKLRTLKQTYKSVKDHNGKSGNNRQKWKHFKIMDEIFSKRAWCNPVAVASSTGLTVKNNSPSLKSPLKSINLSDSDTTDDAFYSEDKDSEIARSLKVKRLTTVQLLAKKLKQKEEHEAKKQKRHDERIELDKKLVNLLMEHLKK